MLKAFGILAALLVLGLSAQSQGLVYTQPILPTYHPGVIVQFKPGRQHPLPARASSRAFAHFPDLVVAHSDSWTTAELLRFFQNRAEVQYAEIDARVQMLDTVPTDPLWSQQWDMAKIAAPRAWDTQTNAANVVVFVIDTGIAFTHPDLAANLWNGPQGEHGYTCMNGLPCVPGGFDDNGHGTHVAGTIGAAGNNGTGIAGINWNIQLATCKFLNELGSGSVSDAIGCFDKILELRQAGVNVRVTNNSWGGGDISQSLQDAMRRVEGAGVVNVCAAGNSGANADSQPMYPAAYTNRALISVLATDTGDAAASFSNYGIASVDIAAPGVNTLSTVPMGICQLCDSTGYRTLSGTSMAAPHVTGVAAALLQRFPNLTAAEARDVLLNPASYDAVSGVASDSSTGGRLNMAKVLSNPLAANPKLNAFPVLTVPPSVLATAGTPVSLCIQAQDADGDALRGRFMRAVNSDSLYAISLFNWAASQLFPNSTGSTVTFTAPSVARSLLGEYVASVADNHGGSDSVVSRITVPAAPSVGLPPSGLFSVSPLSGPSGTTVTVSYSLRDPEGKPVAWDLWSTTKFGAIYQCCYASSIGTLNFSTPGVYRISAEAIDAELQQPVRQTAVVRIGEATGTPPIVNINLDRLSGPAPLTVNVNSAGSFSPDGGPVTTTISASVCSGTDAVQCVFPTPGSYLIQGLTTDASGLTDWMWKYVVVLPAEAAPLPPPPLPPPTPPDTTSPTVAFLSPQDGEVVTGRSVTITIAAGDNVGVISTQILIDGVFVSSARSYKWNVQPKNKKGPHTITAKAFDAAGNVGAVSVGITVK